MSEKEKKIPGGMADAYAVSDDELEMVSGGLPISTMAAMMGKYGRENLDEAEKEAEERKKQATRDFWANTIESVLNAKRNGN